MPANKMNKLLDKIERRLGTRPLNLPAHLQKDKWADEVIEDDTLPTFSRYFPNILRIELDLSQRQVNGWYVIDEYIPNNVIVIGVRDIDWARFSVDSLCLQESAGYGMYDFLTNNYGIGDIGLLQMRADLVSLFNNQVFVEFKAPNMVRLSSVTNTNINRAGGRFPIDLFIQHAPNLMTIDPTKMETFEALATSDVARFLFEDLKYYDGLETVFANVDIKLSDLETWASKRDDIVAEMKDAYVSFANKNQPMIFCC